MSRTGLTLFKELIAVEEQETDDGLRKGRSRDLIALRNDALFARYYYYVTFTDKRLEVIYEVLTNEFYLAEKTITDIVTDNAGEIRKLRNNNTTKDALKKQYPHWVW